MQVGFWSGTDLLTLPQKRKWAAGRFTLDDVVAQPGPVDDLPGPLLHADDSLANDAAAEEHKPIIQRQTLPNGPILAGHGVRSVTTSWETSCNGLNEGGVVPVPICGRAKPVEQRIRRAEVVARRDVITLRGRVILFLQTPDVPHDMLSLREVAISEGYVVRDRRAIGTPSTTPS